MPAPVTPLLFTPDMEHLEPNEAETDIELGAQMHKIQQTTLAHSGHPIRSVHAKSHGVLNGTFTVLPGLPSVLAQGLFAQPAAYDAVVRFSTLPGDILEDSVSTPRGIALKVESVPGPRVEGSEVGTTQDFVMVNGPPLPHPPPRSFSAT